MDDLIRLFIQNERIINNKNNNLKLTNNEAHYINKVMRIKIGKEIFITNGQGSLWKAINLEDNSIKINNINNPYFCLLYTSPSPRDGNVSRMPSSA